MKYKKKYNKLSTQIGGKTIEYKINVKNNEIITIIFDYKNYYDNKNYIKITNFEILYNNKKIEIFNRKFIVNKTFFNNELNFQNKMDTLNKYSDEKFNFNQCENLNIPLEYLVIKDNTDVKTYIESYFRKNTCIITQDQELLNSELANYHNIIKLYITLCIIHNYNNIEMRKYNLRFSDLSQNQKKEKIEMYDEIYKNIPKYIESNIAHDKVCFNVNGSDILLSSTKNKINGSELNVIFDTGNSSISFVSLKMLKYLGIYDDNDQPKPEMINKYVFRNFIKPPLSGVVSGANKSLEKSNLIILYFKFTDQKLKNDKTYRVMSFIHDSADILFGQNTMQQLYDDGYSIKWYISDNYGKNYVEHYKQMYKSLINNDSLIDKFMNDNFDKLNYEQYIIPICNIIIQFYNGILMEVSNLTVENIINIRKKMYDFYKYINYTKTGIKYKKNIYLTFEKMNESYTEDFINDLFIIKD